MNDMTTPNYGLTKPDVGGSDDTWGEKLNVNFDILDTTLKDISNVIPVVPPPISPSSTTPLVESGAGSAGVATAYSRGDHVHPAGPTPPSPATVVPLVESGTGAIGISLKYAREDHIHPLGPGGGGGGGASVTTSDTPPVGAANGDLWWESDTGILYVNYNDGTSTQWVSVYGGIAGNYVAKTGDMMTGSLTVAVNPGPAALTLNGISGGAAGGVVNLQSAGATKWAVGQYKAIMGAGGDDLTFYGTGLPGTALSINYTTNNVSIIAATPSTSPSTGALTVAGGVGIGGNVFAGGNVSGADLYASRGPTEGVLWLGGDATYIHNTGPALTLNGKPVGVTNTTASTSAATGALVVAGGVGIGGALNISANGAYGIGSPVIRANSNTTGELGISFNNTTGRDWQVVSTGTASGLGSGKLSFYDATTGGIVGSRMAIDATGKVEITATTPSTTTTSGALTVAGGVGVGKGLNVYGNSSFQPETPIGGVTISSVSIASHLTLDMFAAPGYSAYLRMGPSGIYSEMQVDNGGNYIFNTNVASVMSIIRAGSVGGTLVLANGNAAFGGAISVASTAVSTSVSTGALTVAGGVGISGALHIPTAAATANTTQAMNMATHGAWQAWTPTVTSAVSGPPTVTTTCRYKQINKMVFFTAVIVITAQNGAGTAIAFTLPVTAASQDFTFVGRENAVTGSLLVCWTPDTTHINIQRYDGTYLGANGHRLVVSGSYEAA
jgi:hypothetical protein